MENSKITPTTAIKVLASAAVDYSGSDGEFSKLTLAALLYAVDIIYEKCPNQVPKNVYEKHRDLIVKQIKEL